MGEPSTKSLSSSFHTALVVSNIKIHVPITFETENIQYANWVELFQVHCRSHKVLHHIIPPKTKDGKDKEKTPLTEDEHDLWDTLDVVVVQWIYSTISTDLLNTVSAMTLWNRLRDLFQDNENSLVVALEHEFNNFYLRDFLSVSAYCQHLKTLFDQLKNMGALVSNNRLVLRMVGGHTPAYKGVASVIRHMKVLPPFYEVRSMLALEETSKKEVAAGNDVAMMVAMRDSDETHDSCPPGQGRGKQPKQRNNNKNQNNKQQGGTGQPPASGPGGAGRNERRTVNVLSHASLVDLDAAAMGCNPCPYLTQSWGRPIGLHQPGILGLRPRSSNNRRMQPPNGLR